MFERQLPQAIATTRCGGEGKGIICTPSALATGGYGVTVTRAGDESPKVLSTGRRRPVSRPGGVRGAGSRCAFGARRQIALKHSTSSMLSAPLCRTDARAKDGGVAQFTHLPVMGTETTSPLRLGPLPPLPSRCDRKVPAGFPTGPARWLVRMRGANHPRPGGAAHITRWSGT